MAKPTSRQELADYCLRALGAPVLEINIDEDQIEDRIDEALQFYQEYHSDAVVRTFLKHQVTQEDYDNNYITLPDELLSVLRVLNLSSGDAADMFSVKYQMFLNDLYGLRKPDSLVNYEMTKQYMNAIELILTGSTQQIIFSRHMNRLSIQDDWKNYVQIGQYIIVEGYQTIDPNEYTNVYNDMLLKKYLTALLKKQWGTNLLKFEGMTLPGGVTINGRAIYEDAIADIEKIETDFDTKYQMPADFYMG
jgi:hypothetical protein